MAEFILVIDEGTTGVRSMVFDRKRNIVSSAYEKLRLSYPDSLRVEQSGEEIYDKTVTTIRGAVEKAGIVPDDIACVGISTQRVTWALWDRATGELLMPMATWMDKRGSSVFKRLKEDKTFEARFPHLHAGLSPQQTPCAVLAFMEENPDIRERMAKGDICFGTVDTWVVYKLTGGKVFASSASNAGTTRILDNQTFDWNVAVFDYLGFNKDIFPEVKNEADDYGFLQADILGREIPITGVVADQQSALFAQACITPFSVKSTNGSGSFVTFNLGEKDLGGRGLYTSIVAWKLKDQVRFMAEGFLPTAGVALEWAKNDLGLCSDFEEMNRLIAETPTTRGVFFSPALSGLRAPLNDATARGAFLGLHGGTTRAHLLRAIIESIAYYNAFIIEDIKEKFEIETVQEVKLSGGVAKNPLLGQLIADITGSKIEQHASLEASAVGAACFAGIQAGLFNLEELEKEVEVVRAFTANENASATKQHYDAWKAAILRTMDWDVLD